MNVLPRRSFAPNWRALRLIRTACLPASLCFYLILGGVVAVGQSIIPARRPPAAATAVAGPEQSTDASSKTLEARLAEARARLAADEAAGDTNAPAGISAQDFTIRRGRLRRLVRLFEQQLSNAVELEAARKRGQDAAQEAQSWARFSEPPPYSILLTDQLRDEIQVEKMKSSSAQAALPTIDALVAENRDALRQSEEKIRLLNEQLEGNQGLSETRLSWQRDLERLQSQVASATLGVLNFERQFREQTQAACRIRIELLQRQLTFASAGVQFTKEDLDKVYNRIPEESDQLERELREAEALVSPALEALEAARSQERLAQADPNRSPAGQILAAETIATRQAQFETAQATVRTLRFMLDAASTERTIWRLRFNSYGTKDRKILEESREHLATYNRRFELWRTLQQQEADASPGQVELVEARLRLLPPDSDLLPLVRQRLEALRESDRLLQRLVDRMERLRRLTQRWGDELQLDEEDLPLLSRVGNLFSSAGAFLSRLWNFELLTAEDTITVEGQTITGKRSITVGKVALAVLFLVLAIWITGLLARIAERLMTRFLKVEARQARLVRRWLRAFLVFCLLISGLALVKIPLTVFAFAGGALAIGLGFGTQNLLKNFVSGILILFERPVRVGDIVEVAGKQGTITVVGLRASVLQLGDGTEIIIPNSALLENNLINCTYSDSKARFIITIGVAYGSDPRQVKDVLADAAKRHGLVENDPKPQVLFTGFGADAMTFELRFWVDITKVDSGHVSSDLRMMIAAALAHCGIVIAVPQRDVHLSAAGPIRVAVVPSPDGPKAAGDPSEHADGKPGLPHPDAMTQETLATINQ